MTTTYYIIPDFHHMDESLGVANKYRANFEYNDFCEPAVYENKEEVQKRIAYYLSLNRPEKQDTLHGMFLDVVINSRDSRIREYSRECLEQSMEIGRQLKVKGVVFHSGLIGTLTIRGYIEDWLNQAEEFFREMAEKYSELDIYIENSFEQSPDALVQLMKRMSDVSNVKLCLDYGHAALTSTPLEVWVKEMAPYIEHMHVNDNDLKADLHLVPGDGKIDFQKMHYLLEEENVNCSALVEVNGVEDQKRAINYLSNYSKKDVNQLLSVLEIGISLSAQKDRNQLFDLIIRKGMEITNCDAGTLYIIKNNALHFTIMKTLSQGIDKGYDGSPIKLPPVPMAEENICAYVALHKHPMNIKDVYHSDIFDFSGPKKYDQMTGYHTGSMLAIPLVNHEDKTVGVLQLINAMDENGNTIAFHQDLERIVFSIASQAAIAVSNMQYVEEMKTQMWSFTEAMTEAIDARTPYNANHTRKVAEYAGMLADYINVLHEKGMENDFFDENRKEQLIMGALLHDIGKLVVPTKVMNKMSRLGDDFDALMSRYELIAVKLENQKLKKIITEADYEEQKKRLDTCKELVVQSNEIGFLNDDLLGKLSDFFDEIYTDGNEEIPFFTEKEKECLSIRKGTLTNEERKIMEEHVVMTERILKRVHFNSYFENSPIWAVQHHECINGKGYPNHLSGDELSLEARILAVADICDALIATDRPYKKPIPKEKAFFIMEDMAKEGNIDGKLIKYLRECMR